MATKKKMLQAAAGNAGGAGLDVEDVFSTYLYTGNGSAQTITNGIDLDGEGGLVWQKRRSSADSHVLSDTVRGLGQVLQSDTAGANQNLTSLFGYQALSDGFSFNTANSVLNTSGSDYASWTLRKAPKFFDVVTYTGDGTNNRQIAHDLGSVPGCIITKMTSGNKDWKVYHRGIDASNPEDYYIHLNETAARVSNSTLFDAPTDTHFVLDSNDDVNGNGDEYVAYLFAHNDGDGDFGPDGDADIIKCGSYTGSTDNTDLKITLGWEPQFVIIKNTSQARSWGMFDAMRGMSHGSNAPLVNANSSGAEDSYAFYNHFIKATADGFIVNSDRDWINNPSDNYIYIAIRRGTKVPESGTEVFAVTDDSSYTTGEVVNAGFTVDTALSKATSTTSDPILESRITSAYLRTSSTAAESRGSSEWDYQKGNQITPWTSGLRHTIYQFRRAPQFFDVVAYNGDATAFPNSRDINHNLGVAPEMMWIKCRSFGENWAVYHSGIGATKYLNLNNTSAAATSGNWWRDTAPTDTVFTIGHQDDVNANGQTHIAYLFASLDGVSKVGSYTGSTSDQTIDCGFSSGARFVLIKNVSAAQGWALFDTERGIVAGNDPALFLNATDAEFTGADFIDPHSSGFTLVGGKTLTNNVTYDYIFYAIA